MRHRLFTVGSIMSLLLSVATLVPWVRSYWVADQIGFADSHKGVWRVVILESASGGLVVLRGSLLPKQPQPPGRFWHRSSIAHGPMKWGLLPAYGTTLRLRFFYLHYAWVTAATLVIPVCWISLWYRNRPRRRSAVCPTCGYDLRASRDRCPECGTIVPVGGGES